MNLHKFAPALMLALLIGGTNVAGAATAPSGPPAQIKIATPGNDGNAMAWYGQDTGIFAQHGLVAEIQPIRRGSGSAIAAAVASGSVDIGEGDIVAIAAAKSHGIPVSILAPSFMYRSALPIQALVVAKTSAIKTAKDLNGGTIGVLSLEGPAKVATQKWLQANGADISTIKFTEITPTTGAQAVARGQITAATINEPFLTPALEITRELADPFDVFGKQVQISAWFAKDDWIAANPAVAQRFAAAMHDTAIWANNPANHAQSATILQKYDGFPDDFLKKMRRAAYGEVYDVSIVQPVLDAATEQKSLAVHVNAHDLISKYTIVK